MPQTKKRILFWICMFIGIGCVAFVIGWTISQKQNADVYETMQEEAVTAPDADSVPDLEDVPDPVLQDEKEPVEIPIDFEKLWETNEHIYAWIRIPGTVIDYPVLQHPTDDAYYLDHTVERTEGLPGSIYTESGNAQDFTDVNTVIYGHNMKNGSMFGDLNLYKDPDYLHEHKEVILYTPEHIYTYEVFAAVTYDNRHILQGFDFTKDSGLTEFLDSLKESRNMSNYMDEDVSITSKDRIITLSTCNGNSSQRFLVEAVLVEEQ